MLDMRVGRLGVFYYFPQALLGQTSKEREKRESREKRKRKKERGKKKEVDQGASLHLWLFQVVFEVYLHF